MRSGAACLATACLLALPGCHLGYGRRAEYDVDAQRIERLEERVRLEHWVRDASDHSGVVVGLSEVVTQPVLRTTRATRSVTLLVPLVDDGHDVPRPLFVRLWQPDNVPPIAMATGAVYAPPLWVFLLPLDLALTLGAAAVDLVTFTLSAPVFLVLAALAGLDPAPSFEALTETGELLSRGPVAGRRVAVAYDDGTREELTTDADGQVRIALQARARAWAASGRTGVTLTLSCGLSSGETARVELWLDPARFAAPAPAARLDTGE